MEAMVGESFLSASVDKLVEMITSREFIVFFRRTKFQSDLSMKLKIFFDEINTEALRCNMEANQD
ncbi:unnamed protein product [Lathyrus oleraceus]